MKKDIKIGSSNFKTIIEDNGYFVDKTMLIKDFLENSCYTLLIPRPKRFGKTLNLSMIEHFFDIRKEESAKLFSEFEIAKEKEFCKKHQNQYPVINISLKDIKANNWEACYEKFKIEISDLFKKHKYLLKSECLDELEKEYFKQIHDETASQTKFEYSLKNLSEYLKNHHKKKVIILVDEYDAPIINAFNNTNSPIKSIDKENKTYYEKVISFMQTLLGKVYKGNNNLDKGLITGVMRVGRESIFSEWNNFDVFGITMPYFSDSFGFTRTETEEILTYFNLNDRIDDIEKWYDGYKFGKVDNIFNPWSIVSYIAKSEAGFRAYWVNSGDYSLIKSRIIELGVKDKIQDLIEGKTIEKQLKENFVFQDFETDNELLWTLLTDNGYLTQTGKAKYGNYKLRIPNNEVRIVFTDIIMSWLNTEVKIKRELLIETAENLINNRITEFETGFKQIVADTFSYFDTAEKKEKETNKKIITHEQIYHVYTLGLLTILTDDFQIKSNRESGEGRYDIMLIPHDKSRNGVVIEIKQIKKQRANEKENKFNKRINTAREKALTQIEKNKYYKELIISKIKPENIIKLAIVFAGKEPYVTKQNEE